MSLRERILAHDDIGKHLIDVPEWGDVKIELRTMTAGERSTMLAEAMGNSGEMDMAKLYPMLIISSAFDPEDGSQIFGVEDIPLLQAKSAAAIERIGQEAMKLSGMGEGVVDEEGKAS